MHGTERRLLKAANDAMIVDALSALEAALASQQAMQQALIHQRYAERFALIATSSNPLDRAQALERARSEQAAELSALAMKTVQQRVSERRMLSQSLRKGYQARLAALLRRQRLERASLGITQRIIMGAKEVRVSVGKRNQRRFALAAGRVQSVLGPRTPTKSPLN